MPVFLEASVDCVSALQQVNLGVKSRGDAVVSNVRRVNHFHRDRDEISIMCPGPT